MLHHGLADGAALEDQDLALALARFEVYVGGASNAHRGVVVSKREHIVLTAAMSPG